MTKLLKTLSLGELKTLYANNNDFQYAVYEDAYEDNMFWQNEWGNEMLGKDNRGYRFHDDHQSFFFSLEDAERFVNDLPKSCRDYLPNDKVELYDKAQRLLDKWQNMTYDEQDEDEGTYNDLEQTAKELLDAIEETLHQFENINDEDIEQALQKIADDCSYMGEWELQDDGTTIAEYKTKLYK